MPPKIQLVTEGVLIRPHILADLYSMFAAAQESVPEVYPWLPWCHPGYTIQECQTWINSCPESWEKGKAYNFAILDSGTQTFLGGCGLSSIDPYHKYANLGYWVRTSRTKRGIATTATLLLAEFGFRELKLNRIEIVIDVANLASQRVAEKAGALKEGVLRNRLASPGGARDAIMFSLIPCDLGL